MNASPFFFNQAYQLTQQGSAFSRNRWSTPGFVAGPRASQRAVLIKDKLFFFAAYQRGVNEDNATGVSQMTVPSGLTDDRSNAGLEAADLAWGGTGTVTIDPVRLRC